MSKQLVKNHIDRAGVKGFSLIEMMVAIAIGIILSIGLIQVMVAGKTAAQATQGANFMQENARFAMSQLTYSLQMADHWGPTNPDKGQSTAAALGVFNGIVASCPGLASTSTSTYVTGQSWWTLGIYGISAADNPNTVLGNNCLPEIHVGSDAVVVRYADSDFIQCVDDNCGTTSPVNAVAASGLLYVRVAAARGMVLATATEITNLASQTYATPLDARYYESPDHLNQDGLYTFPYRLEIYYVRDCSSPIGGTCTAASDNGSPIPTLWRRRLDNNGTLILEPVVEGIEEFKLEYGVASNDVTSGAIPDRFGDIQSYAPATTVGAGNGVAGTNWLKVVSVRVGVIAQGNAFNSSGTRGNVGEVALQGKFSIGSDISPGAKFTPPSTSGQNLLQRSVFTTLGQLRNRDRG